MSAIIVIFLIAILVTVVCIFFILVRMSLMQNVPDANHAKCIANVAHYTGNQFAAQVLLAAAEDYASPEGQHAVAVVARHNPSSTEPIPTLWMRERAAGFQQRAQS